MPYSVNNEVFKVNELLNGSILTFFRGLMKMNFRLYGIESSSDACKVATMRKFNVSFIKISKFIPPKKKEKTIDLIINGERLNFITDDLVIDDKLNFINFNVEFIREYIEKEINWMKRESVLRPGEIKGAKELQTFLEGKLQYLYKIDGHLVDAIEVFPFADFIALITTVLENHFNKDSANGL